MPTQHNKIPIEGLLESYESALTELGYSITTKLLFIKRAGLIIRRHQDEGLVYFDQAVINQYICEIDESYFKGEMQKKYYDRLRGEVDRFVCYVHSGKCSALPSPLRGARQKEIPPNVHPHLFRHSRAMHLAGDHSNLCPCGYGA